MNGEEFIEFAGKIVRFNRAGARSATSRAYYGLYHFTLSLLKRLGCDTSKEFEKHTLLPNYLLCSSSMHAKDAGRLLSDLHTSRHAADYKLSDERIENPETGMLNVASADQAKKLLEEFFRECESDDQLKSEINTIVAKRARNG